MAIPIPALPPASTNWLFAVVEAIGGKAERAANVRRPVQISVRRSVTRVQPPMSARSRRST